MEYSHQSLAGEVLETGLGDFNLTVLSQSKSRIKASNLVSLEDPNDPKIAPPDQGGSDCFEKGGTSNFIFSLPDQIIY